MVALRPYEPDDYDTIHALWLSVPGMGLNSVDDSREGIERYIRRNPTTCFVAELDGEIVGSILAGHDGRRGVIYHLVVSPDKQRLGIGQQLVEASLDALRQEGIAKVLLVVFTHNDKANAFWENLGFTSRPDLVYRNKTLMEMVRYDT